jgi:nucleoside 2-deoxyribosyltransferase
MEEIKWVYIAGPMTNGTETFFDVAAIWKALEMHTVLIERGYVSVCPQLSVLCSLVFPNRVSYPKWLAMDHEYIRQCDVLVRMEGESIGADKECAYAYALGKQVISEDEIDELLPPKS